MRGVLDGLDLIEKFHTEYKIDFDRELAEYLCNLSARSRGTITDLESFDKAMPPLPTKNNDLYYQNQILG